MLDDEPSGVIAQQAVDIVAFVGDPERTIGVKGEPGRDAAGVEELGQLARQRAA